MSSANTRSNVIAITGATGSQGGAVARALLAEGRHTVRVLVRSPPSASQAITDLAAAGAQIAVADLDSPDALEHALRGVYGLFSVQAMDNGSDSERRHADHLVRAARSTGVRQVVHASVSKTGSYEQFPGWGTGRWNEKYWTHKRYAEDAITNGGFESWTLLRPTFFMDNFLPPKAAALYMGLESGKIPVVFRPDRKLQFIDVADTGAFARAAFNEPARFRQQAIDLAGDELTIEEIVHELTRVTGKRVDVDHVTEKEAVAQGMFAALANYQEWTNVVGYTVDIAALRTWGIPLTSFATFFARNREVLFRYLR